MKQLGKYFQGRKLISVLGPIFKLIEALLELLVPLIVARIIDEAIPVGDTSHLFRLMLVMIALGFVGFILAIAAQYFASEAAVGFAKDLTADLYERSIRLNKTRKDAYGGSSLINRIASDTFQIQTGLNIFYRLFLRSPFIVLGSLIMAIQINRQISIWFIWMIVILTIVVIAIMKIASPLLDRIRQRFDKLVTQTREQIQGIRVIKAFNQQHREIEQFKETNQTLTSTLLRVGRINALSNPLTYLTVNFILIGMMWQGGLQVSVGTLTQGQLVALINYLLSILVELVKLAMVLDVINKSLTSARRVNVILEEDTEQLDGETIKTPMDPNMNQAMIIDQVSFSYPGARSNALEDIQLAIRQGDFIGIIGSTGSGKSTLMQLLTKTYEPTEGTIYYHPELFDTQSLSKLRADISVVPGQPTLFKGTIRSNLQMGKENATDAQMWQALDDAQAGEFVRQLTDGLDAPVQAFGRNFSGGQRQRLTIARALIKDSALLIFDDSTSALDYVTESNFQKTLKNNYQDRTIIMISQRIHSLRHADLITVLEAGRQVGVGTHEELLEENTVYQEIYASQSVAEVEK
ncbi:ABC transporter ATP-binding protein [Aerococcaceae bacterium DSM 111020]|nr:ABC transporter ATP-binding protein [Aerococcaceae bacterium DSM 111020]